VCVCLCMCRVCACAVCACAVCVCVVCVCVCVCVLIHTHTHTHTGEQHASKSDLCGNLTRSAEKDKVQKMEGKIALPSDISSFANAAV
jgi:hypothetical protein